MYALAGSVAMKLAKRKRAERNRRDEYDDEDDEGDDDDANEDDDDKGYYARQRRGAFFAGGRRKSNRRSCLVVLMLVVATVLAVFLIGFIAMYREGKFDKRNPDSFTRFRNKSSVLTGKCAKCPFGEVCKAGCSAMAISQTGTLTETPFCIRQ